jgi:hypothetical protein
MDLQFSIPLQKASPEMLHLDIVKGDKGRNARNGMMG